MQINNDVSFTQRYMILGEGKPNKSFNAQILKEYLTNLGESDIFYHFDEDSGIAGVTTSGDTKEFLSKLLFISSKNSPYKKFAQENLAMVKDYFKDAIKVDNAFIESINNFLRTKLGLTNNP